MRRLVLVFVGFATFAPPQNVAPKPELQPRAIDGRQLSVVTSQSAVSASPGATVSLFLDVTPKPKMHVYAPEERGDYIRIELLLDRTPGVRARKAVYPKASNYFFAPLNETFKVYAKPFRIRQDVVLPHTAAFRRQAGAAKSLSVTGTLRYQACDDEVCYRPQEIKVAWTVGLKPRSLK